jgi:hypothetical protein
MKATKHPIRKSSRRPRLRASAVWLIAACLGLLFFAGARSVQAQTPSVTTDKTTYATGEDIVVTFQGGPGNPLDWIGIYPEGVTPGDVGSTRWSYVDGTEDGTVGVADGTITFAGGVPAPGGWVAHLLENDSYTSLASVTFQVEALGPAPRVFAGHSEYLPDEDIVISFINGPGNALDWIGIYPEGADPGGANYSLWFYVDNTDTGSVGLSDGSVIFAGGSLELGNYKAYLYVDDSYTYVAETSFAVVDSFVSGLVRTDARIYAPGQPITVNFSNGSGGAKDWIAVYRAGDTPGDVDSLLWSYVDGTQSGNTGVANGSIQFDEGLSEDGDYVVYFLWNDSYTFWGQEAITVSSLVAGPWLLTVHPIDGSDNNGPIVEFSGAITNGLTSLDVDTIQLKLDGVVVIHETTEQDGLVIVTYANTTFFAAESTHTFELSYQDDADPAESYTNTVEFTVGLYRNINLPAPIYFEDFDGTPQEQLPAGWSEESYTEVVTPESDLGNLDSASYATWIVVEASRFESPLIAYSDPGYEVNYQRVLSANPLNVVNGEVLQGPLAEGQFVMGNSGWRQGLSQVLYLYTPDYDLSGHTDVHVAYYSLWEQNQDSVGAVEYSIDAGQSWLPVVYMLDGPDIVRDAQDTIDAVTTFTQEHNDVAQYVDPITSELVGGTYGTFIAAPISQDLAPFISPRVDDDTVESKRVELFRLPEADDQSQVRFRFAHAGTDSWYFGIDNFGLYSIPETVEPPTLTVSLDEGSLTISWPAEASGFALELTSDLTQLNWTTVDVGGGNSYTVTPSEAAAFYRMRQ